MSNPNFQAMSLKDLQAYVLSHRDDQEVFYAYVDKLHAEADWVDIPPSQSLADLENQTEFAEHVRVNS